MLSPCPADVPLATCCRYGPLKRVQIKRNYAFVEFSNLPDAIDAQKDLHGSFWHGRTITVEFVENSRGQDGWGERRDR